MSIQKRPTKKDHIDHVANTLDHGKFKVFLRYLIRAAEEKRCVTYGDMERLFGFNHSTVGWHAGIAGDYCLINKLPPLNALVINATDFQPSYGFNDYEDYFGCNWGEIVRQCWKKFHTNDRPTISENYIKDPELQEFLDNFEELVEEIDDFFESRS